MTAQTASTASELVPLIYNYHDYREFVRDFISYHKANTQSFSLRSLSKQAGVTPAYISMVLKGRRSLTADSIEKILPALRLDPSEQSYFRLLCTVADSGSQSDRVQALNKLQNFKRYRKVNPKESEVYRYLTKWFYVAIRELAALEDFKPDPEWIQSRLGFKVLQSDIKRALEFLNEFGFINLEKNGKTSLPQKHLDCKEGVFQMALAEFHQQMFELGAQSIRSVPYTERAILGHTMAIKKSDFEKIFQILEDSLKDIAAVEGQARHPDSVYHIALSAFPLTKAQGDTNEND